MRGPNGRRGDGFIWEFDGGGGWKKNTNMDLALNIANLGKHNRLKHHILTANYLALSGQQMQQFEHIQGTDVPSISNNKLKA